MEQRKSGISIGAKAGISRLVTQILTALIRLYQAVLRPWTAGQCRFVPGCSEYAIKAINRFGPAKGVKMALYRLLRCHPFSNGGFDPPDNDTTPR